MFRQHIVDNIPFHAIQLVMISNTQLNRVAHNTNTHARQLAGILNHYTSVRTHRNMTFTTIVQSVPPANLSFEVYLMIIYIVYHHTVFLSRLNLVC